MPFLPLRTTFPELTSKCNLSSPMLRSKHGKEKQLEKDKVRWECEHCHQVGEGWRNA